MGVYAPSLLALMAWLLSSSATGANFSRGIEVPPISSNALTANAASIARASPAPTRDAHESGSTGRARPENRFRPFAPPENSTIATRAATTNVSRGGGGAFVGSDGATTEAEDESDFEGGRPAAAGRGTGRRSAEGRSRLPKRLVDAARKRRRRRASRSWMDKVKLKFLSAETAQALGTIRGIIEAFPDYGVVDLFGTYSPRDVMRSVMALSRLQRVSESGDGDDAGGSGVDGRDDGGRDGGDAAPDERLLGELAHYCAFANAAYGWKGLPFCGRWHAGGNNRVLARSTGIDRRDIVATSWRSKANRPAYYIARDMDRKAIVLAIRGSFSPRDILTDLCASPENFVVEDDPQMGYAGAPPPPLLVGRAHKGMVDAARSVARATGTTVSSELDARPDFSLVVVGHSLGGGVAAVLAAMWRRRLPGRVRSFGYGSPCAFPPDGAGDLGDVVTTVMGAGDPFATISLGHLADVTKALSSLCRDEGFREEILERTGAGSSTSAEGMTSEDLDWCADAMAFLRNQMDSEKLFPPGKIYQMSGPLLDFQSDGSKGGGKGADTAVLKSVNPMIFNEMKLHRRMFDVSLHIPIRYGMVLRRLANQKHEKLNEELP